jgi:hypothetical protein
MSSVTKLAVDPAGQVSLWSVSLFASTLVTRVKFVAASLCAPIDTLEHPINLFHPAIAVAGTSQDFERTDPERNTTAERLVPSTKPGT